MLAVVQACKVGNASLHLAALLSGLVWLWDLLHWQRLRVREACLDPRQPRLRQRGEVCSQDTQRSPEAIPDPEQ